jgi:hypothetical protein
MALGLVLAALYTARGSWDSGRDSAGAARPAARGPAAAVSSPSPSASGFDRPAADALAAEPMLAVDPNAAQPSPLSAAAPGAIQLPAASGVGPAGVPTGFPHTPEGALAQMAALEQTGFETGTLDGIRDVIGSWAAPGGPTPASWSGVAAMAQFLGAAGLSGGGDPQLVLRMTPLMGLIKGAVGPDFAVVCVDFEADATLQATSRVAVADCERMSWDGAAWLVGAGAEPATPPSVWADTDLAIRAGYKDLRRA